MNQNSKKTLIEIYANAWKTLDVNLSTPFSDNKITYSAMWMLENLDHDRYIDYLRRKFDCIYHKNRRKWQNNKCLYVCALIKLT